MLNLTWLALYPKGIRYRTRYATEDFTNILAGKHPSHINDKRPEVLSFIASISNE